MSSSKTINFQMKSSKGAKSESIERFGYIICKWAKQAFDNDIMCNRDASMFEQVAKHGLLTAETEN